MSLLYLILATIYAFVEAQVTAPNCAYDCYIAARSSLGCLGGPFPTSCICTSGFAEAWYNPCIAKSCQAADLPSASRYYTPGLCTALLNLDTTASTASNILPAIITSSLLLQSSLTISSVVPTVVVGTAYVPSSTISGPSSANVVSSIASLPSSAASLSSRSSSFLGFTTAPQSTVGTTAPRTDGSSNDTGRIIGIGAGVGIGCAVIILIGGFLLYKRMQQKKRVPQPTPAPYPQYPELETRVFAPHELYASVQPRVYEMPGKEASAPVVKTYAELRG